MPSQISNPATLTFEYGTKLGYASSNIAITNLRETINLSKTSLGNSYYLYDNITYIISVINNGDSEITDLKITDNLGTYSPDSSLPDRLFTPLDYAGPSNLYINGIFNSEIVPEISSDKITFNIPSIPSATNAVIIYQSKTNDKALLSPNSTIVNKVIAEFDNISEPITASNTLTVSNKADVKIIKNMCPGVITKGETIDYSFSLYNYGNTEAVNVILTDTFYPIPILIGITLNSQNIAFCDYSYINGTLTIPSYGSSLSISIPPAEFTQNPITGVVTINPGIVKLIIKGRI